jgi:hypothetical protein
MDPCGDGDVIGAAATRSREVSGGTKMDVEGNAANDGSSARNVR